MILIDHELDWYINKLKNGEYFSMGMYGDGEWQAIFNNVFKTTYKRNCEHTEYTPELCSLMAQSLKYRSDNFYFSAPDTFKKVPEYFEYERMADIVLKRLNANIEFVEKNVWNKAMCEAKLAPLIRQLRKMDVYIVSNKALRKLDFLNYKGFYEIGYPNCFLDGTLKHAGDEILKDKKPGVYIIAAGIPATLLAQRLHNRISRSFFIDMGSIWDTFVGIGGQRATRAYLYSHPEEYAKWKEDNLKDI